VINEQKLWGIKNTRKKKDQKKMEIIKPIVEKLNEQWFEKGDFIGTGSFDNQKTGMAIFEAAEDKAKKYFDNCSKICSSSSGINIHQ